MALGPQEESEEDEVIRKAPSGKWQGWWGESRFGNMCTRRVPRSRSEEGEVCLLCWGLEGLLCWARVRPGWILSFPPQSHLHCPLVKAEVIWAGAVEPGAVAMLHLEEGGSNRDGNLDLTFQI